MGLKKKIKILLLAILVISLGAFAAFKLNQRMSAQSGAPEISFDTDLIKVSVKATDADLIKGVTASDREDGDISDSIVVESISQIDDDDTATVTYAAFDSGLHVAKASRTVKYTDYRPPVFSLKEPLIYKVSSKLDIMSSIRASDQFDGNISSRIKWYTREANSSLNAVGLYEVEFRVTNSKGTTSVLPLTVEITEANPNPIQLMLTDYLIYLNRNAEFDPFTYYKGRISYNEFTDSLYGIRVDNDVDTSKAGIYTVRYTYDNGTSVSKTKLIVIVE